MFIPPLIRLASKNPGFGFFVKIHLLESSKLNFYDLYFRSYLLMILLPGNVDCNKNFMLCTWILWLLMFVI